jgi:hypothetical protein
MRMRFHGTLVGPRGGQVYKSGTDSLQADVRHESVGAWIEIRCSLVGETPYVQVKAHREGSTALLYEGPIAGS